ncbi:MAG TPA: hypothetical protein VF228_25070 [Iamia sp.]
MPRLLSPRPLAAVVAVVVALALGACSQDEDVTKETFQEDLIERTTTDDEPTISDEAAACITDAIFDDYDQAEVNRIYTAATEDELTNERRDELVVINERCLAEHPLAGDDGDAGSDTTTTEAEG